MSIGAFGGISDCTQVANDAGLPVHVNAAWADSAMICPEYRELWDCVEGADIVVFNPHKWLGPQFDCAVQFLRDPDPQIRTLGLWPVFLETLNSDEPTNLTSGLSLSAAGSVP